MHTSLTRLSLLAGLLLPVTALALTYDTGHNSRYSDRNSFSRSEAAAISVLTDVGAVQGNPDGTFRPARTLNRAEFLKIAMLAYGMDVSDADNARCFPDVPAGSWFSRYVCRAKNEGIIRGEPDGMFHPERAINFAEAVKMIVEIYNFELPVAKANERWAWYRPYILAAGDRGLLFNENMDPATLLTRGQMARIAARFVADDEGELDEFLDFEAGRSSSSVSSTGMSSSRSSSSSSVSSVSSVSSSSLSSASSTSSLSQSASFPARSQFMVAGERTRAIASAAFSNNLEPMHVRGAEVVLEDEITAIDALFLVDSSGTEIAQLNLDPFDSEDKTWKATFAGTYVIPKGEQRVLGVEARMKPRDAGGVSGLLVQVDTFRITVEGEWTQNTYSSAPQTFTFPFHQTSHGRITSAVRSGAETGSLPLGSNQLVAGFTFGGTRSGSSDLRITDLEFSVSKSSTVSAGNWQLGIPENNERVFCTVNGSIVTCPSIPASMATLTSGVRTLRLFADVSLDAGASDPFLQISLNQPGNTSELGAIRWTDGTGTFNWTELDTPIARGTRWQ